ncbi:protein spinster homolog 1-like [Ranitomeya imitator]|uniref:protein spinster homolog 1-like n=1 Tax=Ranitomeya imitator TaxID=111125 RepID=UPI0037E8B5AF
MIGVLLMFVFVKEPTRGATGGNNSKPSSSKAWTSDVKQLRKNWSFLFCTLGMMAVKFASGAIGFHALTFLKRAWDITPCQTEDCDSQDSLIFGGITFIAGICGVVSGVEIAKIYKKCNPRADPLVCASGMLISAIFLFLAIFLGNISLVATYVCLFIGILCLNLNCSVSADIRLYVVSPASRSTAQAIFMIVSDLLGKAGSAYIIGLISDHIKLQNPDSDLWKFCSLQYALMVCPFVVAIGGGFFFACAHFIEEDRKKAETESEDCVLQEVIVTPP